MKKVLFIIMLGLMYGQTTKSVSYEESIKVEIIARKNIKDMARKHAKEDIKIFINKTKYHLPERRISEFNQNYNPELYDIYEYTYLKKIESIKEGNNLTKYLLYTGGGCSIVFLGIVIALVISPPIYIGM